MIADLILISLALIVLVASSVFDIKTREVPDTLSIGFVIVALATRLIYSIITATYSYFIYGLIGFLVMFLVGLAMYRTKQWGGADAKILMGLGAVFATQPYFSNLDYPFLLILLINIILIGGLYGFFFGLVIYFKNRNKARPLYEKNMKKAKKKRIIFLIIVTVIILSTFFTSIIELKTLLVILALFILFYFYLSIFIVTIEAVGFLKYIPLSKVTEGDWLAKDVKLKNKTLVSRKHPCLTKKDLALMKKKKIRKVWIRIGVPFLPAITIATIITLLISIRGF